MVAISATPLEYVRTVCPSCHGFGTPAATQPACIVCGEQWTYTRFDQWIEAYDRPMSWLSWLLPGRRNRYRWDRLPCGHDLDFLTHAESICITCRGVGTIGHWDLSAHYRERITPPAPRASYRPARYPPVAPMHTPRLVETTRTRMSVFDWQRGRYWPAK